MMSRHFALSSELTGAIAKRLPHAKNQLSTPNIRFNTYLIYVPVDTAFTLLTYNGTLEILFSDVNNANFPQSQTIVFPILSENIKLTCDTSMCEWLVERDAVANYSVSDTEYVINVLKIENQGLYSLRRKTSADVTYSTAGFMLTVTGRVSFNFWSHLFPDH